MALQYSTFRAWGLPHGPATNYSATLDATSEAVAWVGYVPQTGTMTHIVFSVAALTTPATAEGRIETLDTSEKPSATLYTTGPDSSGTVLVSAAGLYECPLNGGTGVSVTRGDKIATIIRQPTSGVGNFQVSWGLGDTFQTALQGPRVWFDSSGTIGTWSSNDTFRTHCYGFRYGASYVRANPLAIAPHTGSITAETFVSTTNPDERGNRFIAPFKTRCVGIEARVTVNSPGTCRGRLRAADGTLLASSATMNVLGNAAFLMFDTAAELTAGTAYLVTIESTNSSGNIELWATNYTSNAVMALNPGGANMYKVTLNDGGTVTTTDTRLMGVFPLFDAFDDGVGTGGGGGRTVISKGMNGGLV